MGAKLCCMSLSTSDFDESKAAIGGHELKKPPPSRSMLSCMKKEAAAAEGEEENKRDHGRWLPPEKKAMKMCTKLATLEEWLLSSPGMKPADYIGGGELHVFKQSSKAKKVHPSSSSKVHAELITSSPRDSTISLERIDEGDINRGDIRAGEESLEVGSRSGKAGRRVKFRRPEADIIVFYSPEGTFEEIDKQSP